MVMRFIGIKTLKIFFLLLLSSQCYAQPDVKHLSLGLSQMPYQRDYFFPGQTKWGNELQLKWD